MEPGVMDSDEWLALGEQLRRVDLDRFLRLTKTLRRVIAAHKEVERTSIPLVQNLSSENLSRLNKVS